MRYRLKTDKAIVEVWPWNEYWQWSFTWNDGSCGTSDWNWQPTEALAKKEAKMIYSLRTGDHIKRAIWIEQNSTD